MCEEAQRFYLCLHLGQNSGIDFIDLTFSAIQSNVSDGLSSLNKLSENIFVYFVSFIESSIVMTPAALLCVTFGSGYTVSSLYLGRGGVSMVIVDMCDRKTSSNFFAKR